MKNKKILLTITSLLIVSSLAACGTNNDNDKTMADLNTQETIVEEYENALITKEPIPSKEILETTLKAPAFQVGDTVLYLNEATLQDFINAGGTLVFKDGIKSLDYMQTANVNQHVTLEYKEAYFEAWVLNNSGELAPIKNSIITTIAEVKNETIISTAGIMIGDTYNFVAEKIGKEYETNSDKYIEGAITYNYTASFNDVSLIISFDRNTMKVIKYDLLTPVNYISDINQINEESWLRIEKLCKEALVTDDSSIGKLLTFYTTDKKLNASASLENLIPVKAYIGFLNNVKEPRHIDPLKTTHLTPKNLLIIEFTADYKTDEQTYEGVYGYCYISDIGIDRHGNVEIESYAAFKNGWAAFINEKHVIDHATYDDVRDYSFEDYIWTEKELDW